jgi:Zn-dependent protease with chaperone function
MFILLGISTLLAALLALNSLSALLMAALWRLAGGFTDSWSAATRARILFLMRIVPAALAVLLVALFLAPAYLAYEPRATTEGVSFKLALLAFVSLIGIGLAVFRGLAAWRATARLTADWLTHAQPLRIEGINIPAYAIEHTFPVIAIVGVVEPRLFIARRVLDGLTPDEIAAAAAHESGHLSARDNLKRGLLRACRDALLIIPCGRSLDRAWAEAAEGAADEFAARAWRAAALDLASALVKIARMIPVGSRPTMPAGAFLVGDEVSGVRARVRRLIEIASGDYNSEVRDSFVARLAIWAFTGSLFLLVVTTHGNPYVLPKVHSLIESVVSFLS